MACQYPGPSRHVASSVLTYVYMFDRETAGWDGRYPVRYPVKRHRGEPGHTRDTRNTRYPVKRHRGEPGHTRDTRDTRTHKGTRTTQTNLTTIQPTNNTHPARQRDDRSRGRLNSRLGCLRVLRNLEKNLPEAPQAPKFFEICHSPLHLPPKHTQYSSRPGAVPVCDKFR
jgi:hypothetical protein